MRLFISYSSKDHALVTTLAADLEALGHEVWFDKELSGGQVWWDQILGAIRNSELCIFALTAQSLDSYPCRLEYTYAAAVNKVILPVMLDSVDTSVLPSLLATVQFVDYRHADRQSGINLSRALNNIPSASALPDPLPTPPDAPLSPLARLRDEVEAKTLTFQDQAALVLELKGLLTNPATTVGAHQLLVELRDRHDLFEQPAEELDALLKQRIPRILAGAQKRPTLPGRGWLAAGAALVLLVIVGLVLVQQSSNTASLAAGSNTPSAVSNSTQDASTPDAQGTRIAQNLDALGQTTTKIAANFDALGAPTATQAASAIATASASNGSTDVPTVTTNSQWTRRIQAFDGVQMVLVPPGCFLMGSADFKDALPQTKICFTRSFWIDKFEVTNSQFAFFKGQAAHESNSTDSARPRDSITWFEARDFCASRGTGLALPTEAEWEYAARGPDGLAYPWGNSFVSDNAVFADNSVHESAPVGAVASGASWVGALDMSGNVSEWIRNIYVPYPYTVKNNEGQSPNDTTTARVIRGGSFLDTADLLKSASRHFAVPGTEDNTIGFRCAG